MDINTILQKAFEQDKQMNLQDLLDVKLKEYDISKTKAITLLDIDKDIFNDIINGTAKQPTLLNIIKIAQFLEIDERNLISAVIGNMDVDNIGAIERSKNATFIAKNFDIKKLHKIGFFENTDNVELLISRINTFFGFKSMYEYETELGKLLYSKSKRSYSDKMKDFWVKSAFKCFTDINNPNVYNRERLKDLIVNIKPYSQDVENGLYTVCKALYNVGVTVIVLNQLTTTQIFGATFIVNNKPCIVLTDFYKKYSYLWLTLLHELEHVLYDLDVIASTIFHITGDPDLFLIEEKANDFARDYFCDIDRYNFIKGHIHNPYIIKKFAQESEIHECLLYTSFMIYQKMLNDKNYYSAFGDFFPPYDKAIKNLSPITWKENSLPEIAKELKSIFELNT